MMNKNKLKGQLGFGLISIVLIIGFVIIGAFVLNVIYENKKNRDSQEFLLELNPVSASFYNYNAGDDKMPKAFLAEVEFTLEHSNFNYGSSLQRKAVVNRGHVSSYLEYTISVPKDLVKNSHFKTLFKTYFLRLREEFNKDSFNDVDFNKIYEMQLEMDKIMVENSYGIKYHPASYRLITPEANPKYEFSLKERN